MNILVAVILLVVGLVLVVKGGDWFVDSASWVARALNIPDIIVGMTIVSIGTTLPEIMVSSVSAVKGSVDMAIGNAFGSVIFNTAVILAISFIFMKLTVKRDEIGMPSELLIGAVGVVWLSSFIYDSIPFPISILLLVIFIISLIYNITSATQLKSKQQNEKKASKDWIKNIALFILGGGMIFGGAQLMVNNATVLARTLGVSEKVIGVTILAVGTSLPELVTTITAIRKKNTDIGVGNIIGANLIDVTLILPLCSLLALKPIPVNRSFIRLDFPVCLFVLCVALVPLFFREKVSKIQGILMFLSYIFFVIMMLI